MFKEWSVLKNRFHYSVQKHGIVFGAVANIIQLCIEEGAHQPFLVDYNDNIIWIHIISIYIFICLFTILMLLCFKHGVAWHVTHRAWSPKHIQDRGPTSRSPLGLYHAHDTWHIMMTFIVQYSMYQVQYLVPYCTMKFEFTNDKVTTRYQVPRTRPMAAWPSW